MLQAEVGVSVPNLAVSSHTPSYLLTNKRCTATAWHPKPLRQRSKIALGTPLAPALSECCSTLKLLLWTSVLQYTPWQLLQDCLVCMQVKVLSLVHESKGPFVY